jgi:hypothetical protein
MKLPLSLSNPWRFPLRGAPLRCSVPLPQGLVRQPARELVLADEQDRDCRAQWRVLSTWPDGTARFALLDYAADELPPRTTRRLVLRERSRRETPAPRRPLIRVRQTDDRLTVDTGRLAWSFSRSRFSLGEAIRAHGRDWIRGEASDLLVTDELGFTYRASEGAYTIALEESGPHRVIVRIEGSHGRGEQRFMDYLLRLHFTAGGSQVLLQHHIRNRHAGREGRVFQRTWLEGGLDVGGGAVRRILHLSRGLHSQQAPLEVPERVDLDTDIWPVEITPSKYRCPTAARQLAWSGPATRIRNGASLRESEDDICESIHEKNPRRAVAGDRRHCAGLVDLHEPGAGGLLMRVLNPEADCPYHLGSERNRFEIGFLPENGETYWFGEGMGKSRDLLLNFHDDTLAPLDLFHESANLSYPGVVSPGAQAYRDAAFADLHRTLPFQPNKYVMLESKIDLFKLAQNGRLWPRAIGWMDYGDEYGHRGNLPQQNVWQMINNEEDYLYCTMIDAWRRGGAVGSVAMARHLMDIDYIDYSADPRRNGATCPHSEHHVRGEVYPSHQWCQGLLYYYLATGDEEALRISRRIGDCLCWWITGPQRYALRGSGRETAWPLLSLAALYEVTHEPRYREAALVVVDDMIAIQREHGQVVWESPLGSGIFSPYMLTMSFNGVWDVWAATGEPRALQLWKDITRPVLERLADPGDWGYVVFRNWPIKVADLTVLARWYELTGDRAYIDLGRNGLRLILSGAPQLDNQFLSWFAMWYRHIILYLRYADELGLIDDATCTLVW